MRHITATELGAAVCHAMLRNHDGWPLRMPAPDLTHYRSTTAADGRDEHTVTLVPLAGSVHIVVQGTCVGPAEYAPNDDADVAYPADPAGIVTDGFYELLQAAVEDAVSCLRWPHPAGRARRVNAGPRPALHLVSG